MALTTSGTTTFQLAVDDIIEQALEPSGGEHTSAVEIMKARRVLNLLLIELQNKNIPISKLATVIQPLTNNIFTYVLDPSINDVLQTTIANTSITPVTDILISRKSLKQYQEIPNKLQGNRPNLFTTERLDAGVTVLLWPVPNQTYYSANFLCSVKVQDVNASYQLIDLPTRYLPLLVAWLAYKLSVIRVGVAEEVRNRLQAEYKEIYTDTIEEDRERADMIVHPGGISGR